MASLYKRATPSQHFILRVVEGAVQNAQDAHPEMARIPPKFTRSIAKRATGTLTAQWPDVLAARALSKRNASLSSSRDRSRRSAEANEPASTVAQLHKQLVKRMRALRIGEHYAIYAACQDRAAPDRRRSRRASRSRSRPGCGRRGVKEIAPG